MEIGEGTSEVQRIVIGAPTPSRRLMPAMGTATDDLLARARSVTAIDRASRLGHRERRSPAARGMRSLYPETGRAQIVGIPARPAAANRRSSSAGRPVSRAGFSRRDRRVDPSSPFSGGATSATGSHAGAVPRRRIFIRSMATSGHAGGLARATARVVNVLDLSGRTSSRRDRGCRSGGGSTSSVWSTRVPSSPSRVSATNIQAIKAGVLEIADVLVVNKRIVRAPTTRRAISRQMLSLAKDRPWKTPILRTSAQSGDGLPSSSRRFDKHRAWARESGEYLERRRGAARAAVEALLREALLRELEAGLVIAVLRPRSLACRALARSLRRGRGAPAR